ncbi:MAG: hypothetical protein BAJALOKI2v1_450002 [Promethearchaeota archaeon]|nr:MAG: hypothetical protein BAJALOKI2v1_450002 [Candidatus Lokiarchaeota archaeon]
MTEKEEKKKKLRGFAKIIAENLDPLNEKEKFAKKFKDIDLRILLNANDGRYAALIKIKNGTLEVDGIKNKPKENLSKENVNWDGYLGTSTQTFFDIAMGNISTLGMIWKIITRKIKIKKIKNVLILTELFSILEQ